MPRWLGAPCFENSDTVLPWGFDTSTFRTSSRPVRPAVGRLPLKQRTQVRFLYGSPSAGVAHPGPSCGRKACGGHHKRKAGMHSPRGHDVIQCAPLRSSSDGRAGGCYPPSSGVRGPPPQPWHRGRRFRYPVAIRDTLVRLQPVPPSRSSSSEAERLIANEKVAGSGPAYCSSGSRC